MSKHDHPEACQHTVALCEHCGVCYCTQCDTQWEQLRLPTVAVAPGPYGPPPPHAHQEEPDG